MNPFNLIYAVKAKVIEMKTEYVEKSYRETQRRLVETEARKAIILNVREQTRRQRNGN